MDAHCSQFIRQFFFFRSRCSFILIWTAFFFYLESVRTNNLFHVCHFEAASTTCCWLYAPLFFNSFVPWSSFCFFFVCIHWFIIEFMVDLFHAKYVKWKEKKKNKTPFSCTKEKKVEKNEDRRRCNLIRIWVYKTNGLHILACYEEHTNWKTFQFELETLDVHGPRATTKTRILNFSFDTCWLFFNYTILVYHITESMCYGVRPSYFQFKTDKCHR